MLLNDDEWLDWSCATFSRTQTLNPIDICDELGFLCNDSIGKQASWCYRRQAVLQNSLAGRIPIEPTARQRETLKQFAENMESPVEWFIGAECEVCTWTDGRMEKQSITTRLIKPVDGEVIWF